MRQAFALIAFASRLHGWPLPDDAWSLSEDQRGYAAGIASAPRGLAMAVGGGDESLRRAIGSIVAALTELGAPFMIIGGSAVILRGVARQTNDIDATVWAEGLDVERLLVLLARHGIHGRSADAAAFARAHQVLLLRHDETGQAGGCRRRSSACARARCMAPRRLKTCAYSLRAHRRDSLVRPGARVRPRSLASRRWAITCSAAFIRSGAA